MVGPGSSGEGQSDMAGEHLTSREQGRGLYQRLGPRVTRMWGVMGLLAWEANAGWAFVLLGCYVAKESLPWASGMWILLFQMHWLPAETRSPRWGREKVRSFQSPGPHVKGSSCSRPRGLLEVRCDLGGGGCHSSCGKQLRGTWAIKVLANSASVIKQKVKSMSEGVVSKNWDNVHECILKNILQRWSNIT